MKHVYSVLLRGRIGQDAAACEDSSRVNARILALLSIIVLCLAIGMSDLVYAEVIVYPGKGQDKEQQSKDDYECHKWAVQETGVDPTKMSSQGTTAQEQPSGGRVRGAARGAAVGAVGGAIAGDAGKGAAIGAATGTMVGGMRQRKARREQEAAAQQAQSQQQSQIDLYNRAYGACMEGRGYTIR